jgi:predicted RNA-binding protein with PUA-like domain
MVTPHKEQNSSNPISPRQTWLFQANPLLYRIEESLKKEGSEKWNLRQHHKDVQLGDRVLIWISGKRAGIYALGTVMTTPVVEADSPIGIEYWNDKRQGHRPIARVWVQYNQVFVDQPLLKDFLICDPELWSLKVIRSPRGTNYAVSEEEWLAIRGWIEL